MTNELAIRILTGDVLGTTEQTQEAITMAVRALSKPDVTDTNVGDTISRQTLMKEFSDFVRESNNSDFAPTPTWNDAVSLVGSMPSAERHGRWEHYEHRDPQYDIEGYKTWAEAYKCSNCGFIHTVIEDFGHYAFCPRCGADMREAKNGCDDCFIPMFYNLEDDDSICRDCGVGE